MRADSLVTDRDGTGVLLSVCCCVYCDSHVMASACLYATLSSGSRSKTELPRTTIIPIDSLVARSTASSSTMFRNWSKPRSVPVTLRLPFSFTAQGRNRAASEVWATCWLHLLAVVEHPRHAPFIFLSMYLRTGGAGVCRGGTAAWRRGQPPLPRVSGSRSRAACGAARAASSSSSSASDVLRASPLQRVLGTAGLPGEMSEGRRTSSAQALGRPWRRRARKLPPRLLCSHDGCGVVRVGRGLREASTVA